MISRISVRLRWLRRKLGRTHWTARLLGIRPPDGEAELPGLIILQLDGLSRTQMERALEQGNLPFLASLIRRQHFSLESFYSGVPSTTPAVQGEIFFGVRGAVPSFQFLRRKSGKILRMYEADAAREIEQELEKDCPEPLLKGGHAYSDIYRAGAIHSRYCSQDLAPDELLGKLHPFKSLLLVIAYAPTIFRMASLAVLEFGLAVVDAFRGLYQREDFMKELAFVPSRVMVCIVLRELIRLRVLLDIERGVPLIHANFLGYDEQAHRRGPDSVFAHWTLKGIDRTLRDLYEAAGQCGYRDYELMVHSDHGQERVVPFQKRHGRRLDEALGEVFAHGPLAGRKIWTGTLPGPIGQALEHALNFFGMKTMAGINIGPPEPDYQIIVTAMGPLGHLYFPEQPSARDMATYAANLVAQAGIPLVLWRTEDGKVQAFNRLGVWHLPEDRAVVLGEAHPFLDEAAADLVHLCGHPDAGDLVISGWDPGQPPLSFPMENGAHGGPGFEETRGFLLVPDRIRRWHVAHLEKTGQRVRGGDLRNIVLHFLGRDGEREERVPHHPPYQHDVPIRVMTYNVHSCAGMDGKVRPERVARVINYFDPDVVAVQEIDAHRPRSGRHDQSQLIAGHLRMEHVFQAMFEEEKERYGIAIFSKHPFTILKAAYLTEAAPHRFREARGAIWIRIEPAGRSPFHFVNTHFGLGRRERCQQADTLLGGEWLGSIPDSEPLIVCGDFNSSPRSQAYHKLQQRLRDAQLSVSGHKPCPTFSSVKPLLRIDHVFVSRHFKVEEVEVPDTPTAELASDHLPLFVELTLHPSHDAS